jgi:hypothetical protein
LVRCYAANKQTDEIVLALPLPARTAAAPAAVPVGPKRKWVLVTMGSPAPLSAGFTPSPSRWIVVGRTPPPSHDGLPSPEPTPKFVDDGEIAVFAITPFRDSLVAIDITFGDMHIVALPCSTALASHPGASPFKEEFDIAVCSGAGHREAGRLNELLRPSRLVYLPPPHVNSVPSSLHPNLRAMLAGSAPLTMRTDARGRVRDIEPD